MPQQIKSVHNKEKIIRYLMSSIFDFQIVGIRNNILVFINFQFSIDFTLKLGLTGF